MSLKKSRMFILFDQKYSKNSNIVKYYYIDNNKNYYS